MDFDAATAELYRVLPTEFVAARDAKATEARWAGDRTRATQIKGLRRPSVAAWLTNWLARERPAELDRLLALGAAMREAQDGLQGEALRGLSRQRRQVVTALSTAARHAGRQAGLAVSEATVVEFEATLLAAMVDEGAATLVRSGYLTAALTPPSGLETFSTTVVPPTGPTRPAGDTTAQSPVASEVEAKRQQAAAVEQAFQAASAATEAARAALHEPTQKLATATKRYDEIRGKVANLQGQLERAVAEAEDARTTMRSAQKAYEQAQSVLTATQAQLEEARAQRDRLPQ